MRTISHFLLTAAAGRSRVLSDRKPAMEFLLLGAAGISSKRRWGRPLLWLAAGMMGHTVVDVLTHHSDGPLLLFPLNWTYRFASPVSYWEADHFGREFTVVEWVVNALLLAWFAWRGVRWWKAKDPDAAQDRHRSRNRDSGS